MSLVQDNPKSLEAATRFDPLEVAEALAGLVSQEGIHELTLRDGEQQLRLRRRQKPEPAATAAGPTDAAPMAEATVEEEVGTPVRSQVVGLFHPSTTPAGDPLVVVGSRVESGQVLGFVESMSISHELRSPCAGSVLEILAEEADPVEYGQPLLVIG